MGEAVKPLEEEVNLEILESSALEVVQPENLGDYIAKEYADHRNTEGFRHDILSMVSAKRYRAVLAEIEAFYKVKCETMPSFNIKAKRYFDYVKQLIEAIDEHKSIPHFEDLPTAQQKQINEQVFNYFDELNNTLKRIEKVIHDLKVHDVRSTIWFIRTTTYCVMFVLCLMAVMEAVEWLGNPFPALFEGVESLFFDGM